MLPFVWEANAHKLRVFEMPGLSGRTEHFWEMWYWHFFRHFQERGVSRWQQLLTPSSTPSPQSWRKWVSVDILTLTDLGFGGFLPFSLSRQTWKWRKKSCCIVLPPLWAAEHWKHAVWLADLQWQILGDLILTNDLNPNPTTKACLGLLEPVCYQICFRFFKSVLCQCTHLPSNI